MQVFFFSRIHYSLAVAKGLQLPGNIFSVQMPAASNKNHAETRTKPYRSTP